MAVSDFYVHSFFSLEVWINYMFLYRKDYFFNAAFAPSSKKKQL